MRIRIADRSQLADLVEYLRRCDCTIGFHGGELDVRPRLLPVEESRRHEELELSSFLRTWTALHPDAEVELIPDRPGRRVSPRSGPGQAGVSTTY